MVLGPFENNLHNWYGDVATVIEIAVKYNKLKKTQIWAPANIFLQKSSSTLNFGL
jgi:hypothetical protein